MQSDMKLIYKRIDTADDELYAFCLNQKAYYALEDTVVTKEYLIEDMQILEGYEKSGHYCIKIYLEEIMVGYIDYQYDYRFSMQHDSRYVWIGLFLVDELYQGKHLGTQIINDFLASLDNSVLHIQLACLNHNQKGLSFWQSLGFYKIGESHYKHFPTTIFQYDILKK